MKNKYIFSVFGISVIAILLFIYLRYPFLFELIEYRELDAIISGLWTYESYIMASANYDGEANINVNQEKLSNDTYEITYNIENSTGFKEFYLAESNNNSIKTHNITGNNISITSEKNNNTILRGITESDYDKTIYSFNVGDERLNIDTISGYPINMIYVDAKVNENKDSNDNLIINEDETVDVELRWDSYHGRLDSFEGVHRTEIYIEQLEFHTSSGEIYTLENAGDTKTIQLSEYESIAIVTKSAIDGKRFINRCTKRCI